MRAGATLGRLKGTGLLILATTYASHPLQVSNPSTGAPGANTLASANQNRQPRCTGRSALEWAQHSRRFIKRRAKKTLEKVPCF